MGRGRPPVSYDCGEGGELRASSAHYSWHWREKTEPCPRSLAEHHLYVRGYRKLRAKDAPPRRYAVFAAHWEDGDAFFSVTGGDLSSRVAEMRRGEHPGTAAKEGEPFTVIRYGEFPERDAAMRFRAALMAVLPYRALNKYPGWYFCDVRYGPTPAHWRFHIDRSERPCPGSVAQRDLHRSKARFSARL